MTSTPMGLLDFEADAVWSNLHVFGLGEEWKDRKTIPSLVQPLRAHTGMCGAVLVKKPSLASTKAKASLFQQ